MLVFLSKISAMAYNVIGEIDELFEWHAWNNNLTRTNAAVADLQMLLLKHSVPGRGRIDDHLGSARMRVEKSTELVLILGALKQLYSSS